MCDRIMHVCMYVCTRMHVFMMYVCMYVCMYVRFYDVRTYVCMYIFMYVFFMYVQYVVWDHSIITRLILAIFDPPPYHYVRILKIFQTPPPILT